MSTSQLKGEFYIVATPIGNLRDITLRAIEILKDVNMILAEDTRKTKILLDHYQIKTMVMSYRDQNHNRVFPKILHYLQQGRNLALVSDSGTPLISDPGFKLINKLLEFEIKVVSIPGPSALITALSISGLPTDNFTFLGFLPKGAAKRKKILDTFGKLETTLVIYESPFRIIKLLNQVKEKLGNRTVCVTNELTKKFEKVWRGKVNEVEEKMEKCKLKGEFTVLVAKEGFG
jgi:16S rRNA (cytidine1402-2'-O)-methyltransferase